MSLHERAAAAIRRLPRWRAHEVTILSTLGGGPSSDSFLVERRGRRYVLRIDTPLAKRLGLDRSGELDAHRAAALAGLAPAIEFALPAEGFLVCHYVDGRTWQAGDLGDKDNLALLATKLRALHRLTPDVRCFDLAAALTRYARIIDTQQARGWASEAKALLAALGRREARLCHNDLVARNIIQGEKLWLIDFEYAALGDPLFDLAVVIRHHGLGADLVWSFLRAYFGDDCDVTATALKTLDDYCLVYDHLVRLWQGAAGVKTEPLA